MLRNEIDIVGQVVQQAVKAWHTHALRRQRSAATPFKCFVYSYHLCELPHFIAAVVYILLVKSV